MIERAEKYADVRGEWKAVEGTWAAVGRHMPWRKEVEGLADRVARRLLGVGDGQDIPPVSVSHFFGSFGRVNRRQARQNADVAVYRDPYPERRQVFPTGRISQELTGPDFPDWWLKLEPAHYAFVAHRLMTDIRHKLDVEVKHILVMTEEDDPEWL